MSIELERCEQFSRPSVEMAALTDIVSSYREIYCIATSVWLALKLNIEDP